MVAERYHIQQKPIRHNTAQSKTTRIFQKERTQDGVRGCSFSFYVGSYFKEVPVLLCVTLCHQKQTIQVLRAQKFSALCQSKTHRCNPDCKSYAQVQRQHTVQPYVKHPPYNATRQKLPSFKGKTSNIQS